MRPTLSLLQQMLLLSEKDVRKCLSMKDCLAVNRKALVAVASGKAQVPTRLLLSYQPKKKIKDQQECDDAAAATPETKEALDWSLFKPAAYTSDDDNDEMLMGIKVVSVRSQNPAKGLPLVPATVLHMNAETGQVDAVLASTFLTGARTAAGSALATAKIRPDMKHLVVFGAGLQAELHIHAIATAIERPIPLTTIINRTSGRAIKLRERLPQEWTTESKVVLLEDSLAVAEALSSADVVVTATNTATPLFDGSLLPSKCHINGVGSYTPDMQEVSARTVNRCRVLIDTPEAKLVGDLKGLSQQHPVKLLGEILMDKDSDKDKDKSLSEEPSSLLDCTFYKAVGTAIQDVLTADMVVQRAREAGIGTEVDMS